MEIYNNLKVITKPREIAVIVKLGPKTAERLNHTQNGIYITDKNDNVIPEHDELNRNDKDLHAVYESRVFTVPNVTPRSKLKLVFGETKQEVEFSVPYDKEYCEVTLEDSTLPENI